MGALLVLVVVLVIEPVSRVRLSLDEDNMVDAQWSCGVGRASRYTK
jgi:hypothetical protein